MKATIGFLAIAGVAYLAVCVYLFAAQRSMIYYPVPESHHDAAMDLRVDTGSAEIKIWRTGRLSDHAIIYFGGNAEDVALNISDFSQHLPDYTMYLVNYRGYGGSSGKPAEDLIYHDALFLFDHLNPRFESVSIIARSLGTGVASYIAAQRQIRRLVLVTPFDSLLDVARVHFNLFPVSMLMRDRFNSHERADCIRAPSLVILAEDDEIIPRENSMRLVEAMQGSETTVQIIADSTHNTVSDDYRYMQHIRGFLAIGEEAP